MINTARKRLALLLLAAACTLSAGCRASVQEDAAGADWRTWGLVQATGVMIRNGQETPVCVCVRDNSVEFYYDQPEQVRFANAVYPETLPDAAAAFRSISLDDLNGDGSSDIRMDFQSGSTFIWYWSESEGFVLQTSNQ